MSVTRRQFIQNGLGFVSLGLTMPGFLLRASEAIAQEKSTPAAGMLKGASGKILVVIEMSGGNDGLNTVVPYATPEYSKARPNIAIAKDAALQIGQSGGMHLGLHPRLKGLHELFDKGHLGVVTGVGYPNPNRSHFESMDVWQLGDPDSKRAREGWLARYIDADGHLKNTSLPGIALGEQLPLALNAPGSAAAVIGNGGDYGFGMAAPDRNQQMQAFNAMYAPEKTSVGTAASSSDEFIRNVGNEVYTSTQAIKDAIKSYDERAGEKASYPNNNGLASRLQTISKLITGGLSTRVYYASIGGFDTHANQPGGHANTLGQLGDAIAAFMKDLELQGRANDVLVMTFSEFGRRVHENGSAGTDHGAASVLFVAGGGVRGGVYGQYPSLSDLDDGDLKFTTDFRSVYSAILDKWLGAPSDKILGGSFSPLKFV
jgi:uncharacterized protein (DUF1501 family)